MPLCKFVTLVIFFSVYYLIPKEIETLKRFKYPLRKIEMQNIFLLVPYLCNRDTVRLQSRIFSLVFCKIPFVLVLSGDSA
jgi:hypothetical protein